MQSTQLVLLLLVGASMWSGAVGLIPEVVPEFPRADPCVPAGVCGEPLFLTPLIQAGSIKQAQQEAEVRRMHCLGLVVRGWACGDGVEDVSGHTGRAFTHNLLWIRHGQHHHQQQPFLLVPPVHGREPRCTIGNVATGRTGCQLLVWLVCGGTLWFFFVAEAPTCFGI